MPDDYVHLSSHQCEYILFSKTEELQKSYMLIPSLLVLETNFVNNLNFWSFHRILLKTYGLTQWNETMEYLGFSESVKATFLLYMYHQLVVFRRDQF